MLLFALVHRKFSLDFRSLASYILVCIKGNLNTIKYGGDVLIWASPEAQPMTRIQVHIVLLGGDTRKHQQEGGEKRQGGKEANTLGCKSFLWLP